MFVEKEVLPSDPGLDWVFSEGVINLGYHLYDDLSKQGVMSSSASFDFCYCCCTGKQRIFFLIICWKSPRSVFWQVLEEAWQGMILSFGLVFTRLSLGARWNGISMPSAQGGELSVDQGRTKGVFSLSTPGWVYFVLPQKEEFEWRKYEESIRRSMRKETALVPCMQSQPQKHMLGTRGCVAASSGYLRGLRWSVFTAGYYSIRFVEWCTISKE